MRRIHSSNSVFLMEIILNILLFCVLLAIGLQFFMRAHTQTEQTKMLHQAVTSCESVAALFQNGNGTLKGLSADCPYSTRQDGQVCIYLDSDFLFCPSQDASYYIRAELSSGKKDALRKLKITCYTAADESLYTMTACHYTPLRSALSDALTKEVS